MVKTLLFAALALSLAVGCIPADESKMGPSLLAHLENTSIGERVPIVLVVDRPADDDDRTQLINSLDPAAAFDADERIRLIEELEKATGRRVFSLTTLLTALRLSLQVADEPSLWATRCICASASSTAISLLSRLGSVRSIRFDELRTVAEPPNWTGTDDPAETKDPMRWALDRIAAKGAQEHGKGLNGGDVVVAVIDSGVNYDHVDLAARIWVNEAEVSGISNHDDDGNGFEDDVRGWNFRDGNAEVMDLNRSSKWMHGTFVAGLIAGRGTGVAPGARIMALRVMDQTLSARECETWEAIEYATRHGARVINFSGGWRHGEGDPTCWREVVDTVTNLNVLFVTIAHNDRNRPGTPYNVRIPGNVPSAMTIGASNRRDAIAGFSNHGPVTWQDVPQFADHPHPPGLLKPDGSAPGVQMWSTRPHGDQGTHRGGTSFAAPLFAGTAALLLEKDATLSSFELRYLLQESARDIEELDKPDVMSGWGRLDALAAVEQGGGRPPYDLSVAAGEVWVETLEGRDLLRARVRNLGTGIVANARIEFEVAGDEGTDWTPAGSYTIPVLGPVGSRQETAVGTVSLEAVGGADAISSFDVSVRAPEFNGEDADPSNNRAIGDLL